MPPINWNEIRSRALTFSHEWAKAAKEEPDKQTFWNEFFKCFGLKRQLVASFEVAVQKAKGKYSFLDLLWRKKLLVEHKSAGASFEEAKSQAFAYIADLVNEGNGEDTPEYVILCDFKRFGLYDLTSEDEAGHYFECALGDLHKHVRRFAFMRNEKPVRLDPESPANFKATQLLADLHDALAESGYVGHELERMLVRLLFCLFAEDTGIFDEPRCFTSLIERTREDGADLGGKLAELFQVLNTPENKRQKALDEDLAAFPYVNGGLFAEALSIASFTGAHREALRRCCMFEWAYISPAVFGSLFQDILDDRARRQVGAHYTSERDITKVTRSLFLDDLRAELENAKGAGRGREEKLRAFKKKLRGLRLFDPACGCGNFLIIAYRELRRLEMEALLALHTKNGILQRTYDIRNLAEVDVDQFYGLEINEWPVRIAEVGLWLTDHQCNLEMAEKFGETYRRLPLSASPTIRHANALRIDWKELLPPAESVLVFGNPPFVGKQFMDAEQNVDMELVCKDIKGFGVLDYVTAWYVKAAEYVKGTRARCAFVSTNSISQGEQVGLLWKHLQRHGVKIHFAHRTFPWQSEARGKAHVHVVIIGFGTFDHSPKWLYEYEGENGEVSAATAKHISPYLVEGPDTVVTSRGSPLCPVPEIVFGSMPNDGGHLLLSPEEKVALLKTEPGAEEFLRPILGSEEFINGAERWCLWLDGAPPEKLRALPEVRKRIEGVRQHREASKRKTTQELAAFPARFGEVRQPESDYILIPSVSSERRRYIPMGFMPPNVIASNLVLLVPKATVYHFGVLTSAMHMAWVGTVCGRLKSDYRYSNRLVYNNFPWPAEVPEKERRAVETAAQAVLDARKAFPASTLADLYDPLTMPPALATAHAGLDRAVDRCYRKEAFRSDRERVEHLFAMYEKLTAPIFPISPKMRRGRVAGRSTKPGSV